MAEKKKILYMQSFRKLVRGWTFIKINGCLTQIS